jgi:integrase
MPRSKNELTVRAVAALKRPGMYCVGGAPGLYLQVLPTGGRTWIFRFMIGGRRRDMGLGGFDDLSLAEARDAAREARSRVRTTREGREKGEALPDPIDAKRAAKSAVLAAAVSTLSFKAAAESYIAAHEPSWRNPKHAAQWAATLKTYAYPAIGALAVADIDVAHLLRVLEPIWTTKTETASRVRGRIESVLDWAKVRGYRAGENPARWKGHLDQLLPARAKVAKPKHHDAMAVSDVGAFVQRLREADGMGARALEFAILTAARSGEVRGATWGEVDLESKAWTIPGARMKAGRDHRVPLSKAAVDVLSKLPRMAGSDLLFPAPRGGQLSDMTLSAVMRRMNVGAVPHGFRSTFRDWAAERTAFPHEMQEMALAHAIDSKVEAAYRRGDLFEKRRRMMEAWATFCAKVERSGAANVTALRGMA